VAAIRPGTDAALAMAVMHEWIVHELYDRITWLKRPPVSMNGAATCWEFRTGYRRRRNGRQRKPACRPRNARSLARIWGSRKTYLAAGGLGAGFGGACRSATGAQWARCMVLMMAMQDGQARDQFREPAMGVPMDLNFYFPGYAEGGISGDITNTGSAPHNYVRMPHVRP